MANQKCLITGVCGMMPSAAAAYLVKHHPELDIYGVDDFSGSYKDNIPEGIHFTEMDLRDTNLVREYFNTHFSDGSLTYVINYAASAQEIKSYFCPIDITSRNFDLFRNVLTNALEHKVKHVTFFSSMSRFGNGDVLNDNNEIVLTQRAPFTEDYIASPLDPYATSKVACELLLKSMKQVYDFDYTIFVPHSCFSPLQYVEPFRNFLAIWYNLILMNKAPTIYGNGENVRAISWTDDFTPTTCETIFNPAAYNQTFNIGGDDHKTINEWYAIVKRITGTKLDAVHRLDRPGEVPIAYCSHEKAERILGFKNKTNIENALAEMWEHFKEKGPREFKYGDGFEINSDKIPTTWKNRLF